VKYFPIIPILLIVLAWVIWKHVCSRCGCRRIGKRRALPWQDVRRCIRNGNGTRRKGRDMPDRVLTEYDVQSIANAIAERSHHCRFDQHEAQALHNFAQSMDNGGLERWNAILAFGDALIRAKRAGITALVLTMVGGALALLWAGLVGKLGGK